MSDRLVQVGHPSDELCTFPQNYPLFGFHPPISPVAPKPIGEWNQSLIKQFDGKIEFYLNGVLTAKEDFNSSHWKELVANSGFKTFPSFGKQVQGRIALQDWSKGISFRSLKIKTL